MRIELDFTGLQRKNGEKVHKSLKYYRNVTVDVIKP